MSRFFDYFRGPSHWPKAEAIAVYPDGRVIIVAYEDLPPLVFPDRPVAPTEPAVFDDSELEKK